MKLIKLFIVNKILNPGPGILFFLLSLIQLNCNSKLKFDVSEANIPSNVATQVTCREVSIKETCFACFSPLFVEKSKLIYEPRTSSNQEKQLFMEDSKGDLFLVSLNAVVENNLMSYRIVPEDDEENQAYENMKKCIREIQECLNDEKQTSEEKIKKLESEAYNLIRGENLEDKKEDFERIKQLFDKEAFINLLFFYYVKLFGNARNVTYYADGQVKLAINIIRNIVKLWYPRWEANNSYAPLVIFIKKEIGEYISIGHVVLGFGNMNQGEAVGAIIINYAFQNNGYGKKVKKLIASYISFLKKNKMPNGANLKVISATANSDNIASCKLLEKTNASYKGISSGGKNIYQLDIRYSLCQWFLKQPFVGGNRCFIGLEKLFYPSTKYSSIERFLQDKKFI